MFSVILFSESNQGLFLPELQLCRLHYNLSHLRFRGSMQL